MLPSIPKYKLPPKPPLGDRLNRPQEPSSEETFSGIVQGKTASKLEERIARSLDKLGDLIEGYTFGYTVNTPFSLPGEGNKVDFAVWMFAGTQPLEIDGDWIHKSAGDKGQDELRDGLVNETMASRGWLPIIRIKGHEIETQEMSDAVIEELF
jgi:hypothetical protein